MQEKRIVDVDITRILSSLTLQKNGDTEFSENTLHEEDDLETIHVYIYREEPKKNTIVDADIPKDTVHSFGVVIACFIFSLLPIFSIAFQIFIFFNPPTAIITLIPIQKDLSARTDIQLVPINPGPNQILGHMLAPITISESKIAPATGRGHQNAVYAKGTITFYNGSSTSQNVPEGTTLIGKDGVSVATDYSITIPPATPSTPPTFGSVSVNAHAIVTGPGGNIEAEDINTHTHTHILSST
jgi:Baseplate J-like protein